MMLRQQVPQPPMPPVAPVIDSSRLARPLVLQYDQQTSISVNITGVPAPVVRWHIGRKRVKDTSKYRMEAVNHLYTLVIARVSKELEEGVWVVASNDYGEDSCHLAVTVSQKTESLPRTKQSSSKRESEPPLSPNSSKPTASPRDRKISTDDPANDSGMASLEPDGTSFDRSYDSDRNNRRRTRSSNRSSGRQSESAKKHSTDAICDVSPTSPVHPATRKDGMQVEASILHKPQPSTSNQKPPSYPSNNPAAAAPGTVSHEPVVVTAVRRNKRSSNNSVSSSTSSMNADRRSTSVADNPPSSGELQRKLRITSDVPQEVSFLPTQTGKAGDRMSVPPRPQLPTKPYIDNMRLAKPLRMTYAQLASISVYISGIPTPTVKWYIGRKRVKESSKYHMDDENQRYTLVISKATEELEEGVVVVATNEHGEDICRLEVTICKVTDEQRTSVGSDAEVITNDNRTRGSRRRKGSTENPVTNVITPSPAGRDCVSLNTSIDVLRVRDPLRDRSSTRSTGRRSASTDGRKKYRSTDAVFGKAPGLSVAPNTQQPKQHLSQGRGSTGDDTGLGQAEAGVQVNMRKKSKTRTGSASTIRNNVDSQDKGPSSSEHPTTPNRTSSVFEDRPIVLHIQEGVTEPIVVRTPSQVPAPPLIDNSKLSKPLLLEYDQPTSITVNVTGSPAPVVRWHIGHKKVKDSSKYRMESDGRRQTLVVAKAGAELEQGVWVTARNEHGEDSCLLDVTVYQAINGHKLSIGSDARQIPGQVISNGASETPKVSKPSKKRVSRTRESDSIMSLDTWKATESHDQKTSLDDPSIVSKVVSSKERDSVSLDRSYDTPMIESLQDRHATHFSSRRLLSSGRPTKSCSTEAIFGDSSSLSVPLSIQCEGIQMGSNNPQKVDERSKQGKSPQLDKSVDVEISVVTPYVEIRKKKKVPTATLR